METENQRIIGLALPKDCEITHDERNRQVLVLTENSARYITRMLENAQRTIVRDEVRAEAEQSGADMSTYMDWQLGVGGVVWTARNCPVMVQRVEPGHLAPDDARALAQVLNEAADYAEGENEIQEPTNIRPDGTPEWELTEDVSLHVVVRDGSIHLGGKALHPLVAKQLADNLGGALLYLVNQQEGEK